MLASGCIDSGKPRPSSSSVSDQAYKTIYCEYSKPSIRCDSSTYAPVNHTPSPSTEVRFDPASDLWSEARILILEHNILKYLKIDLLNKESDVLYQQRALEVIDAIAKCEKELDSVAKKLDMSREAMMEHRRSREHGESVSLVRFSLWLMAFLVVSIGPLALLPLVGWMLKDEVVE